MPDGSFVPLIAARSRSSGDVATAAWCGRSVGIELRTRNGHGWARQ